MSVLRDSQRGEADGGFTLVELLVVVIILGILASISIPVYYRQREHVWDAAVKGDLRNAATAQETFLSESNPGPFATSIAELENVGFRPSAPANYYGESFNMTVTAVASYSYCLTARSATGTWFALSSQTGWVTRTSSIDPVTCS